MEGTHDVLGPVGLSTHGQGRGPVVADSTGIKARCLAVSHEGKWWNVVVSRRDGALLYERMCATSVQGAAIRRVTPVDRGWLQLRDNDNQLKVTGMMEGSFPLGPSLADAGIGIQRWLVSGSPNHLCG